MTYIKYAVLAFLFCSCKSYITAKEALRRGHPVYRIDKIDSTGNWYQFYAFKSDSVFKIVVEKNYDMRCRKVKKIKVGRYYNLSLATYGPLVMNYMRVICHSFDEGTSICTEPEAGYFYLYGTKDIAGLCYVKEETSR